MLLNAQTNENNKNYQQNQTLHKNQNKLNITTTAPMHSHSSSNHNQLQIIPHNKHHRIQTKHERMIEHYNLYSQNANSEVPTSIPPSILFLTLQAPMPEPCHAH